MPIPQEYLNRMEQIGTRLIGIESRSPGLVRMRANPTQIPSAVSLLKSNGFKKPFLTSGTQFVYDCFLSYQLGAELILPFTLLAGTEEQTGRVSCWTGIGQYAGWQGQFQLADFSEGNKMRCVLIINCEPFFDSISDLLDPVA